MGWWACTIAGGDQPLDTIADIEEHLQGYMPKEFLASFEDEDALRVLTCLEEEVGSDIYVAYQNALKIADMDKFFSSDDEVDLQVLAQVYLGLGAEITDAERQIFIDAGMRDEWAGNSEERRSYILAYINAVKNYTGTPLFEVSEGLFEHMAVKLNNINHEFKAHEWMTKDELAMHYESEKRKVEAQLQKH